MSECDSSDVLEPELPELPTLARLLALLGIFDVKSQKPYRRGFLRVLAVKQGGGFGVVFTSTKSCSLTLSLKVTQCLKNDNPLFTSKCIKCMAKFAEEEAKLSSCCGKQTSSRSFVT